MPEARIQCYRHQPYLNGALARFPNAIRLDSSVNN